MIPIPTVVDADALLCTELCYADYSTGSATCTDAPECKAHNVMSVMDYVQVQARKNPNPPACKDGYAEFQRWSTMVKSGVLYTPGKGASSINWSAILAALLPVLMSILQDLVPGLLVPPAPAPTP